MQRRIVMTLATCSIVVFSSAACGEDPDPVDTTTTYVLVHGSFLGAWTWDRVAAGLSEQGHTAITIDLPGHGDDTTPIDQVTLESYTQKLVDVLDAQGEPVILAAHSMGGIVISQAAEARSERVDSLLYLSAFLLRDGESLFDVAFTDEESLLPPNLIMNPDGTLDVQADALGDIFCGDCAPEDVDALRARVTTEASIPLATPIAVTEANFGSVPRFCVISSRDNAVGPVLQQQMYTASGCDSTTTIDTSHLSVLSNPDLVIEQLTSIP